jgi:hypothetical protein
MMHTKVSCSSIIFNLKVITNKTMTLIKNVFKILAVTALFSSANVFATDFLVDTTINDANNDAHGGSKYNIDKMDIKWASNDVITVDIYTNFIGSNNKYSRGQGNNRIVLGDLLIGTQGGSDPAYDYAFVLSDNDRKGNYSQDWRYTNGGRSWAYDNHWNKQGTFTEIDSTITARGYHGQDASIGSGEVMAGNRVGTGIQSDWSIDNYGRHTGNTDKISFSFNVSGIDAFQNASQLAFSWAMSCANDVVDGVVNVDRPTSVPEPGTLLLMLLALGFMAKSYSKKANGFSA